MLKLKWKYILTTALNTLFIIGVILFKPMVIKIILGILFIASCTIMDMVISDAELSYLALLRFVYALKISEIKSQTIGKEVSVEEAGIKFDSNIFNTVDNTNEEIFRVVNSLLKESHTIIVFDRVVSYVELSYDVSDKLATILTMNSVSNRIRVMGQVGIIDISGIVSGVTKSELNDGYSIEIVCNNGGIGSTFCLTKP